ncbi:MAG: polysaccharide pyruvyl transferase family protein [Desulfocapsaceae bacterium]|nr:polysaccharide pyruvyl transferase family protein [Desulfocapsaceae bacterium]
MKILHVASFLGNIGDNASHMGFKRILDSFFNRYEIQRLEIRKFYKNYKLEDKCEFNQQFIDFANTFDLLVIGGGGFLDYWVKDSATGTTIDIHPGLLKKLTTPLLICSIGCNPHREVPEGNIAKLRTFLDELCAQPKIKIALRNDGSVNSFKKEIGEHYLEHMEEILDNGYFYEPIESPILITNRRYAAVNITNDQLAMKSSLRGDIDTQSYYDQLAKSLTYLITQEKLNVVLIPHIHSDLKAISELLSKVDDFLVRQFITIAPCIQYDEGAHLLFSIYKNSSLILGMRYHANVCNMAMIKPIVGLAALDRVQYAYDSLGLRNRCVTIDGLFFDDLVNKISTSLHETDESVNKYRKSVNLAKERTLKIYGQIFSALGIVQ